MKKCISVLLAFVLLFTLCACSAKGESGEVPLASKNYMQLNNLDIESVSMNDEDTSRAGNYLVISGLKDKDLEKRINEELKAAYDDQMTTDSIPAYRGSKLLFAPFKDAQPHHTYCYENNGYNGGNILSVMVSGGRSYRIEKEDGYEDYFDCGEMLCFNYDLTTGRQLQLGDLFKNKEEGFTYINNYIYGLIEKESLADEMAYPIDWSYDYKIVGFDGIKEDQKFYINPFSNSISLILDYETPWVVRDYYSCTPSEITISLEGVVELSELIKSSKNIFENEEAVYALKTKNEDANEQVHDYVNEYSYRGIPNLYYYEETSYGDSMPQAVKEYVQGYAKRFVDEDFATLTETYTDYEHQYMTLEYTASASTIGSYSVMHGNAYMSASYTGENGENWENLMYLGDHHSETVVMDNETGKIVTLEDLFIPGYDVEGLLKEKGIPLDIPFYLAISEISFIDPHGWNYYSLPYKDIGCSNLVIFK